MYTIKKIKEEFSFIEAFNGLSSCYHNSMAFNVKGNLCDIYFMSEKGNLLQSQIDYFIDFKNKYQHYLPEIKNSFLPFFSRNDQQKIILGNFDLITFDVIEVPHSNKDYDLMLLCTIKIRRLLLFQKEVCLEVKIQNQKIKTTVRKN